MSTVIDNSEVVNIIMHECKSLVFKFGSVLRLKIRVTAPVEHITIVLHLWFENPCPCTISLWKVAITAVMLIGALLGIALLTY